MVLNRIEELLSKYDRAETNLQEEQELRDYFTGAEVAPHLECYRPIFQYFRVSQKEVFTKDVPLKTKKKSLYQWISVAAVSILMLGILLPKVYGSQKSLADYSQEEQQMYLKAKNALAMLSNNFNQGTTSLNTLNLASENFNAGLKKANYITEFNQSTSKLLKN